MKSVRTFRVAVMSCSPLRIAAVLGTYMYHSLPYAFLTFKERDREGREGKEEERVFSLRLVCGHDDVYACTCLSCGIVLLSLSQQKKRQINY